MTGHEKTPGKIRLELNAAAGHLENFAAFVAAKVMMMFLARNLVTRGLPGQNNRGQPVLFHQSRYIAVDGCNADALDHLSGRVKRLFRRKRTIRAEKSRPNGVFLPCLS